MIDQTKGTVLFVDDDKFLADMYSMKFTAAGYTVQACLSVSEALQALRTGFAAEAIVFDLVMPEQDGFSLLETIKKERLSSAVLIALTNQSDDMEKKKAESIGVDRYIVKATMIPSEVVHLVEEEIGKKRKASP